MPPLTLLIYLLHFDPDDSLIFADAINLPSCFLSLSINIFLCHRFSLTHYSINALAAMQVESRTAFVCVFFTALHGMQTRSCDENSVRPSVRLSVRQTREL